jgi:hypothetical protein
MKKPHSSNTRYSACAVALKPPPQLADPQNDLIWTVADVTELDLATAHIGGYGSSSGGRGRSRSVMPGGGWYGNLTGQNRR